MKSTPLISLCIPCFNVERYITDCLESIITQDVENCLIEIVCVDDCSTDNTLNVIKKFKEEHQSHRIKIISLEKNAGVANARNIARYNSSGKYVWFVDSDDKIVSSSLRFIIDVIKDTNPDVCFGKYSKSVIYSNLGGGGYELFEAKNLYECAPYCIDNQKKRALIWCTIFRRAFLDQYDIKFDEEFTISEDLDFYLFFPHNFKAVKLDRLIYFYRFNPKSITSSQGTLKKGYQAFVRMCEKYTTINPHSLSYDELSTWRNSMAHNIISCLVRVPERKYVIEQLSYLKGKGLYPYPSNKAIWENNRITLKGIILYLLNKMAIFNCLNIGYCIKNKFNHK